MRVRRARDVRNAVACLERRLTVEPDTAVRWLPWTAGGNRSVHVHTNRQGCADGGLPTGDDHLCAPYDYQTNIEGVSGISGSPAWPVGKKHWWVAGIASNNQCETCN